MRYPMNPPPLIPDIFQPHLPPITLDLTRFRTTCPIGFSLLAINRPRLTMISNRPQDEIGWWVAGGVGICRESVVEGSWDIACIPTSCDNIFAPYSRFISTGNI